ncbi:transcriptional regulator, AraC family protein [Synechococcus sp. PCC 7335]|uniref:helix-turn-helix transcriptional regulator n=1 Tax=Synechococcus sp. (strain ATCC 29403 / PCC 7335) TaxID=91464 RepID=UPI00017EE7B6|nr:AraC family transcriptional regulator [Synechococcus sp. PCC 7335]EDX84479.1 transcriptional regulator, AraC family protein [Synechococcus sp. PCC 7335]
MTISLIQEDYWHLVYESEHKTCNRQNEAFETVWQYPVQLGQGSYCSIELRDGLELGIEQRQLHDELVICLPERTHPIEYVFCVEGKGECISSISSGQYALYGSGIAPKETLVYLADEPSLEINVHIEPSVLRSFLGSSFDPTETPLQYLFRDQTQIYTERIGVTTAAMQTALHQLLNCPFTGVIKKAYLESKVWELMTLLIDQELRQHDVKQQANRLKTDDIERIHHAKKILLQQVSDPPSLLNLARQVGLNDCTLKRGFRQVFGETAFGYLHNHRMETARQLLIEGEMNVSEAARSVGFSSRSYFAAAFRRKYGSSPREYLRQH